MGTSLTAFPMAFFSGKATQTAVMTGIITLIGGSAFPAQGTTQPLRVGAEQLRLQAQATAAPRAEENTATSTPEATDTSVPVLSGPITYQVPEQQLRLLQMPTANTLPEGGVKVDLGFTSTFGGGRQGGGGGSGNQNYFGTVDWGATNWLQLGLVYAQADDPLYSTIGNVPGSTAANSRPANLWQSVGATVKARLNDDPTYRLAALASLEWWQQLSGGGSGGSPSLFSSSGAATLNNSIAGSLAFPNTFQLSPEFALTLSPQVSFLPGNLNGFTYYGTNFSLGAGASWFIGNRVNLYANGTIPFGPGFNSFDSNLVFQNLPTWTTGVNYTINRRIGLEAFLTNGFGGSPASSLLTLPSYSTVLYGGKFTYTPSNPDSPSLVTNRRDRSLFFDGITITSGYVPPAGTVQTRLVADSLGSVDWKITASASNDFQFEFLLGETGGFNADQYLNSGIDPQGQIQFRGGGKVVFANQLRGDAITYAGRLTLGRAAIQSDQSLQQGYLMLENIFNWQATPGLSLTVNPKVAFNGGDSPVGIGVGANIELTEWLQLLPEVNAVLTGQPSNFTLGLRFFPYESLALDIYGSNASKTMEIGQLVGDSVGKRVGAAISLRF